MTAEELKRDFESAHIKHVHFKSKMRSYLFGRAGEPGPVRDPEQCSFGQWIADRLRGQGAYAHLPEAREVDRQHVLIHREANRVMDMHKAGQVEEAIARFGSVQEIADEIVVLLRTIETKMRRQA